MAREMYKRRRYCRFSAEGITEVDYKELSVRQLNSLLEGALESEDYELAASVRDELDKRK